MPQNRNRGQRKGGAPRTTPAPAPIAPSTVPTSIAPSPTVASPAPPSDRAQLITLMETIEKERQSRVLVYWTSDMARISEAAVIPLYDQLSAIGPVQKLDLVLYTRGGDTEVPWRMVSLMREFAKELYVLIPHRAQSAGTLLAVGANQIVMTPLGALGPIDPSRTHPLLPSGSGDPEPVSVQDMRHAMKFIREAGSENETEMPYTPEAMAQIFAALFEKIHPLAIGAIEQSYALSKLIGRRCLESHMDPKQDDAKIGSIVDKLCDDYKSHAYQISRSEARDVGLDVLDATAPVEKALMDLYKLMLARPVMPVPPPLAGKAFSSNIAWFESTAMHLRCEASFIADKNGKLEPQGDRWTTY